MAALRKLSTIYVLAASTYAVMIVLARHPDLNAAAKRAAHYAGAKGAAAAIVLNEDVVQPGWTLLRRESDRAYEAALAALTSPQHEVSTAHRVRAAAPAHPAKRRVAQTRVAKAVAPKLHTRPQPQPRKLAAKAPAVSHVPQTTVTLNLAPPPKPKSAAPKLLPPPKNSLNPVVLVRVEQRLKDSLTADLYAHFDLFLYVSKAETGPLAQRMYVFAKGSAGHLTLRDYWAVSTGREKVEYNTAGRKLPSYTPKGYYELDPHRMYRHYRSMQWGVRMPYAMFFNWEHDGYKTGIAIHAAQGKEVALLGQRASAGCIRLAPKDARALFDLIRRHYRGKVPRFAYDRRTHTMANDGMLMHRADGRLRFYKGYKVLVVIENYGGKNVVAALM